MRALILALAAAGALAASGPLHAQGVSMPPYPEINLAGFNGDASSLPKAVAAIEAASGGRVVEIRYNNVSGAPGYDVVLERGAQVSFQRFTKPGGGMIALTGKTEPSWMLKWQARRDVSFVKQAKVSLAAAIRTAESSLPGPAVAAGIARSASSITTDVHAYNVAILNGGRLHRVAIDSATGLMIDDPNALGGW